MERPSPIRREGEVIHVKRGTDVPDVLKSEAVKAVMEKAREFYKMPLKVRAQRRFDMYAEAKDVKGLFEALMPPLLALFRNKCAFCESPLTRSAAPEAHYFRTPQGAINLAGEKSPDHYWWLAFDWRNVYLACSDCSRTKGQRFPVKGPRAPLEASWEKLKEEAALLLDPCADLPEEHLVFSEEGVVAAVHVNDLSPREREHFGVPTRGEATIDAFALNRRNLIELRAEEAGKFLAELQTAPATAAGSSEWNREIQTLLPPDTTFLQMKRQLLARWQRQQAPTKGPKRPTPEWFNLANM